MTRRRLFTGSAAISLLAAVACNDASAPTPPQFDAGEVNARFERFDGVLDGQVWQSFGVLGPAFASAQTSGAAGIIGVSAAASAVPRIPFEIRGRTFVLDAETLQYVVDPDRSDAPENGVRFALYAVNPITRQPEPATEIGHADLTDRGDDLASGVSMRLEVVSDGTTFVDYAVTAAGDGGSGTLEVAGFVSDPHNRIDFDIAAEHAARDDGENANLDFEIDIPAHGFLATAAVENQHSESGAAGRVALTVEAGETEIEFAAEGTPETIDAEVRVDGQLFATIRGSHQGPEIRDAGGNPLGQEQLQALHHIMGLNGRAFTMFERLIQPVGPILGLGMVP